ncbi:DUF2630 family protein [Streptomyces sp. NPDC047737]|uniref:DUF2630 family protein n=1 Tax=unclassified Streptomyces TaxID=2593676 RepID=UPI003402C24D
MADQDIFERIDVLVTEERALRSRPTASLGLSSEERSRLHEVEVQLDQCWDLLRQRRALAEYGGDPSTAKVRPADEVEGYRS